MALDPSIALGVKPVEVQNPLNAFAQMSQIQNYQRQNELANRAIEQEDALNRAYAASLDKTTGQINPNVLRQNVAGANLGSKLPAIEASLLTSRKLKTEVDKNETELRIQNANRAVKDIAGFNTREEIIADIQRNLNLGNIDPTKAQQLIASVPQNPAEVAGWQLKTLRGILDAKDQLEQTFTSQDFGGGVRVIATPKYAGGGGAQMVSGSDIKKTMTPEGVATNERERQRIAQENTRIANAENPKAVARQTIASDGTVTNFNKFGEVVSTVKGAGKPSATYEKTEAQKKTLAADQKLVISELKEAIKEGGLIDVSTGSGAGRLVDMGAGFFGKATEGDIAIGRLQPIADLVLKTVPRFEGPQSDKDTASYKEAAGNLSNANLPRAKRKAAAEEIIRLMEARRGQFITQDMASGNTAVPSGIAPPEGFVPDPQ
jgi:hypothetical protein